MIILINDPLLGHWRIANSIAFWAGVCTSMEPWMMIIFCWSQFAEGFWIVWFYQQVATPNRPIYVFFKFKMNTGWLCMYICIIFKIMKMRRRRRMKAQECSVNAECDYMVVWRVIGVWMLSPRSKIWIYSPLPFNFWLRLLLYRVYMH